MISTLMVLVAVSACGNKEKNTEETTKETQSVEESTKAEESTEAQIQSTKVKYTVTVVDVDGNPINKAMVQLCKDSCVPAVTNESGVAEFELDEADYKVSIITMPEGYAYNTDETEFYFESGSKEMTIVLKKQ